MAVLALGLSALSAMAQRVEMLGAEGQRTRAEIFASPDAKSHPVLVIVLHGDAPFNKPSYQYAFAASAAKERTGRELRRHTRKELAPAGAVGTVCCTRVPQNVTGIVAAALLRPGYTDGRGGHSDGVRGNTTGDNYTPQVLAQLTAAIRQLQAELQPSKTVLVGHSGGSAIAADLLAREPGLAQGALLVSCPCDVPKWRKYVKNVYPTPLWDQPVSSVSPLAVVGSIAPSAKVRMVVGDKDHVTPVMFTDSYAAALRQHGVDVHVTTLPGLEHEIFLEPQIIGELRQLIESLT
ncbi:MAG TPA: alpha/beta hydrolase [Bryobacteraceae bacterium]|nr:alpha/beta hydrolase [Bryobacteraceae bacterium]